MENEGGFSFCKTIDQATTWKIFPWSSMLIPSRFVKNTNPWDCILCLPSFWMSVSTYISVTVIWGQGRKYPSTFFVLTLTVPQNQGKALANIITITYFSLTLDSSFMPFSKVGNPSSPYSWPLPSTHCLCGSFVTWVGLIPPSAT